MTTPQCFVLFSTSCRLCVSDATQTTGVHLPLCADDTCMLYMPHTKRCHVLSKSSAASRHWSPVKDTYLPTYLLTPWSRVLPEKLTGSQLVKKFPAFYGTRRFITAFTSARHLSLSWARSIQSMPSHPTSWRSILILSSHLLLDLPSGLFPPGFPTKFLYAPLLIPCVLHAPPISFFSILSPEQYWVRSTDH